MATFRNRHGKWQARVQRKGQQPVSKSFQSKEDAQRWARQVETEIDKGSYTNAALAERTLFKDVIERYVQEVTLKTRSMKEDTYRLRALARHPIARLRMTAITPIKVAEYRDERLKNVSNGAVIRELSYFSSIINHARREWGINIVNPIPLVKKPASPQGRSRTLSNDELERLLKACIPRVKNGNIWVLPVVKFALASAMRRGEILGLRWSDISFDRHTAYIPLTKNGTSRTVPLSSEALTILRELPRSLDGRVFPINGPNLSVIFDKARRIAKVEDFHFHDLRHMAITRLAEKLPNLIELSAVSGHKSLAMLKRYYHPNPEHLAKKIA
jgi:integrase